MTSTPLHITPEAYLEVERKRDARHEYENGKIIPMGGASKEHNRIVRNFLTAIWNYLKSKEAYEAYANDRRVFCPTPSKYFYPDILITKGEEQYADAQFDTLLNPFIIVEVLSNSTKDRDRTTKFEAYRSIAKFSEYVLVAQDKYCVESFYKNDQNEWIIQEPVYGIEQTFSFSHLDFNVSLQEIYNKIPLQSDK